MSRSLRRVVVPLALAAVFGGCFAAPARAQDDDEVDADDDDFDTTWFGARLGLFYRPSMNLQAQVSGDPGGTGLGSFFGLLGTSIDIERDLGVTETVESEYMFNNGILEGEVFFDTRFASISVWGIAPYEYRGDTTITRTINFGGQQFSASTPVESKFRQYHAGLDIKINIINNKFVRLSPVVGVRLLGIDWEVRELTTGRKGDTSDIDTPLKYDDAAIIPYPEVGLEVRAGLREWIEADAKLTGSVFTYDNMEGGTLTLDVGVTAYPIPFLGVRVGGRYMEFDIKSADDDDPDDSFDLDLEYLGATLSVIVRFG
jgi:hypothetical protein